MTSPLNIDEAVRELLASPASEHKRRSLDLLREGIHRRGSISPRGDLFRPTAPLVSPSLMHALISKVDVDDDAGILDVAAEFGGPAAVALIAFRLRTDWWAASIRSHALRAVEMIGGPLAVDVLVSLALSPTTADERQSALTALYVLSAYESSEYQEGGMYPESASALTFWAGWKWSLLGHRLADAVFALEQLGVRHPPLLPRLRSVIGSVVTRAEPEFRLHLHMH